ncbi:hypothetical protein ACOCJ4_15745 [Knoellia sp. CPCC 206435]|uniref:hypothetical protein n=1 Tax=Knoellia terrae TaxID=3404797 RepID=UPI003B435A03
MSTISRTENETSTTGPVASDVATGTQQWVALASVLAGAIHLAVTPEHLEEWWVFGTFFLVLGCFQLACAVVVLRRPTRGVALAGIVANLAVVLVYVSSRTTGLPIEPPEDITSHAWSHVAEGAGPADLAATAAELAVICLLVTLLSPRLRRMVVNLLLITGVGLWVLRLSGSLG